MDVAKILIEKGANVNAKADKGETALYIAAEKGNFLTSNQYLLMKNGIN